MTGDLDMIGDLPPASPLPPEVRQRVLHTVLREIDIDDDPRPAQQRRGPLLAAAAAVVTVLLASVAAVGLVGGAPQLRPATPPDGVETTLARCAAAVENGGWVPRFPPADQWRVTAVLADAPQERVILLNDWFACAASSDRVSLTTTVAPPESQAVERLSATLLLLRNPERQQIEFTSVDGTQRTTAPLTLVRTSEPWTWPVEGIISPGQSTAEGLVPGADYYELVDRPEAADGVPEVVALQRCMDSSLPVGGKPGVAGNAVSWAPVGDSPQRIGRSGGYAAAFCVIGPTGPVYAAGPIPTEPAAVASWRSADRTVVLVTAGLRDDVRRVEIKSAQGTEPAIGARCTLDRRLALCDLPVGAADVYVLGSEDGSGPATLLPR